MSRTSLPTWRQITVIGIVFLLLAGFTLMYVCYYIPNNRQHTNQYGLRILQLVENNISNKESYLEKLYLNNIRSTIGADSASQFIRNRQNVAGWKDGPVANDTGHLNFYTLVDSIRPTISPETDTVFPHRGKIDNKITIKIDSENVVYQTTYTYTPPPSQGMGSAIQKRNRVIAEKRDTYRKNIASKDGAVSKERSASKDDIAVKENGVSKESIVSQSASVNDPTGSAIQPGTIKKDIVLNTRISSLVRPLMSYRHEFFESFALIKVNDKHKGILVYEDGLLSSMGEEIELDTFFAAKQGDMFSRIIPMQIGGVKYMLFAQPFSLRHQQLLLCGMMKMDAYNEYVNVIPMNFVFSVIIIFLILMISLPFFKFRMIGKADDVGIADIVYITLSLFAGMTIVTLIVAQGVLLISGRLRAEDELRQLNHKVEQEFYTETGQISDEAHYLDAAFAQQLKHKSDSISRAQLLAAIMRVSGNDRAGQSKRLSSGNLLRYAGGKSPGNAAGYRSRSAGDATGAGAQSPGDPTATGTQSSNNAADYATGASSIFAGVKLGDTTTYNTVRLKDTTAYTRGGVVPVYWKPLPTQVSGLSFFSIHLADSLQALAPIDPDSLRLLMKIVARRDYEVAATIDLYHGEDTYRYFDRVVWTDRNGDERFKAQRGNPNLAFINSRSRDYFKRFVDQRTYPEPLKPDNDFILEPLFSQSSGDFRINYVIRSQIDSLFLVTLTTQMYSLMHTNFPAGYGYFLMNEQGQVVSHTEAQRNLREFFPDETDHPEFVWEAVNSRQDTFFTARYYGKDHSVFIHPLKSLPFFLVTYCENDVQVTRSLRILMFTLCFDIVLYLLVLLLVGFFFFYPLRKYEVVPILFYLRWMVPKNALAPYYKWGGICTIIGSLCLLVVASWGSTSSDDQTYFALALLLPADMLVMLRAAYLHFNPVDNWRKQNNWLPLVILVIAVALAFWLLDLYSSPRPWQFLIPQVLVVLIAAMWTYNSHLPKLYRAIDKSAIGGIFLLIRNMVQPISPAAEEHKEPAYIVNYSWFVISLICCISIIPTIIFGLYAYNHEIAQSMKQQQLHLARRLQNERADIWRTLFPELPAEQPHNQQQYGQYRMGLYPRSVYSIYKEHVFLLNGLNNKDLIQQYYDTTRLPEEQESFYFKISNGITRDYHDSLRYPALNMASSDGSWSWHDNDTAIALWYNYLPDHQLPGPGPNEGALITFNYPRHYYLLNKPGVLFLLTLLTFVLCYRSYVRVKQSAKRLFLLVLLKGGSKPRMPCWDRKDGDESSDLQRQAEIKQAGANWSWYERVWAGFSPDQQMILWQIEHSGITNIENGAALYSLIDQGWLVPSEDMLRIKEPAFAYFIGEKVNTAGMRQLKRSLQKNSNWRALKIPLQIILLFAAGFIFFTQEGLFQRGLAMLMSLGSMLGVIKNLPFSWGKSGGGDDSGS